MWVLNHCQVGVLDANIQYHPLGWIFFLSHYKSTLKFNYNLRGLFTTNSQFFYFLCRFIFTWISFKKTFNDLLAFIHFYWYVFFKIEVVFLLENGGKFFWSKNHILQIYRKPLLDFVQIFAVRKNLYVDGRLVFTTPILNFVRVYVLSICISAFMKWHGIPIYLEPRPHNIF